MTTAVHDELERHEAELFRLGGEVARLKDRDAHHDLDLAVIRTAQVEQGKAIGRIEAQTHALLFNGREETSKVIEISRLKHENVLLQGREAERRGDEKRRIDWWLTLAGGLALALGSRVVEWLWHFASVGR